MRRCLPRRKPPALRAVDRRAGGRTSTVNRAKAPVANLKSHAEIGGDRSGMVLRVGVRPDSAGLRSPNPPRTKIQKVRAEPPPLRARREAGIAKLLLGLADLGEFAQIQRFAVASQDIDMDVEAIENGGEFHGRDVQPLFPVHGIANFTPQRFIALGAGRSRRMGPLSKSKRGAGPRGGGRVRESS